MLDYTKPRITVMLSRNTHTVTALLYGSMDLVQPSLIDTNVYRMSFDRGIVLGDAPEKIASVLGSASKRSNEGGVLTWEYDHGTNLVVLSFANNKLVLIALKFKHLR